MNNRAVGLTFLFVSAIFSLNTEGVELKHDYYDGMQLAWVRLPNTTTAEEVTATSKPVPAQTPAIKPTPAPVAKPVQVPVAKPVLAPSVKPLQAPVTIPAQAEVIKPVQPPVSKQKQAFEWVIGLGADFGGEEIGTLYYTDGSSSVVKANNGIVFYVGGIVPNGKESAFSTQLTLGYKFGGPRGSNGDITWSAIPLEGVEYYRANSLRLGLGLSYQISPQLSVNIPASSYVNKYDNAIGLIAQIGWAPVGAHYSIDLRYTSIKFKQQGVQDAPTVNGSVAGIYTSYRF